MRWLSESVEALIADELSKVHNAVVIGSGYGGAVAALRLAEKGHSVLVLERGEEYLPGEFPNDIANLPGHLRLERWNAKKVEGNESGLFDMRIGENTGVLVGNALGGTSQINANVAIEPDSCVYGKPEWPKGLTEDKLAQSFIEAREVLEVKRWNPRWPCVQKYAALRDLGRTLRTSARSSEPPPCLKGCSVSFASADIAVNLGNSGKNTAGVPTHPCVGCGDCVSGCNHFAKNTLTTNYLARARAAGARMFTGVTVLDLAPDRDTEGPLWKIRFVRTADRASLRNYKKGSVELDKELRVRTVILSAGSLGSTEILQRSRKLNKLDLSRKLGRQFSGNGDYLAFGYLQEKVVQSVGWGSRCDAPAPAAPAVGPTITGLIRIEDQNDPRRCTLIEEGSVPGAVARIFHELVTTMAALSQLTSESYRGEGLKHPQLDPLVLQPEAQTHTQTLLAMGHDLARGILKYDKDKDRLKIRWPGLKREPVYQLHDERLRYVEDLGAIYLQNPAWRPLPDTLRGALSGPVLGGSMFTVHPLGGCPMGDSVEAGVVNDVGAVYDGSGGHHEGLYVLDGSIIPCSLGVNPLLTIAAIAERAMREIIPGLRNWSKAPGARGLPGFPQDSSPKHPYANPHGDRLALQFTEVLRGKIRYRESADARWREREHDASLVLHLPVADLQRFFESPSHPIEILGPRGNDIEGVTARFELGAAPGTVETFEVASGTVEIFERNAPTGWRRVGALLRVALTWFVERGYDDLVRALERKLDITLSSASEPKVPFRTMLGDWVKLVKHATEIRTFGYGINLQRDGRAFSLEGAKHFEYAASWGALWRYVREWFASPPGKRPYLQRRDVWTSLGLLEIELYDDGRGLIARGDLTMDLVDMTRHYAAQLGPKRDTASALLEFAGYPLMFLRAMIKMRLWDFRLPDYPEYVPAELSPRGERPPVPDAKWNLKTRWPDFPSLMRGSGSEKIDPRPWVELKVQRSRTDTVKDVCVRLTRYAQKKKLVPEKTGDGMLQVRAIMLINGFATPTLPFVATEIPQNLAEYFHGEGYDVWLFDYRSSTILDSSKQASTMDDIAEYDIPAAVGRIIDEYERELGADPSKLQIYAFAHCVGAASMAMSMLGGYLERPQGGSMIAGVIFSQMQAFLIGGRTAQMRIPVGTLLREVAGVEVLRLSAAEGKPTAFESLIDRLLATLPTPDAERCPHENDRVVDRPDIVTCKRACGVISRLFNHARLSEETHRKLDVYFGRANTKLLIHGTKCLEYERLVNADGQNVYVTDANIQSYFKLPIALLHGSDNALFDIESCGTTYAQLARVNGRSFARGHYVPIEVSGYAHFDCIVGEKAYQDVFPELGKFLTKAWKLNVEGVNRTNPPPTSKWAGYASRVAAPVTGPILGWTRVENGRCKLRLWIQVDEREGDRAWCAMTVLRSHGSGAAPQVDTWPIIRIALEQEPQAGPAAPLGHVAIAIADLDLPASDPHGYDMDMVSLHVSPRQSSPANPDPDSDIPTPAKDFKVEPTPHGVMTPVQVMNANPAVLVVATAAEGLIEQTGDAPLRGNPLNWIHQIRARFSEQARNRQETRISGKDANTMLGVLKQSIRETCKTALSPNPHTLSRKRRGLPREDAWTAHIRPSTLAGPGPDGTLRFLAGCCRYPGMKFEAKRADSTFKYINDLLEPNERDEREAVHRDFMFMLGDQIYADATAGLFDPRSSVEKFSTRYERAFSSVEFRRLARQLPLYMVIDDHEIDNDWSRDEFAKGPNAERLFFTAMSSFAAYQWAHSPRNLAASGFNYRFEAGGYRFLVLDTRTQRVRHARPAVLADDQMRLLDSWLREGEDNGKPRFVVTGSVLAPGLLQADPTRADACVDSWQMAQDQRKAVLELVTQGPRNVVFLSGDYHCAATATLEFKGTPRAYAIVSPPLYAPYVYANARGCEVMRSETLSLKGGPVSITADVSEGNGFSDIRVDRLSGGRWSLEVSTYALRFEDETPQFIPSTRQFVLS